MAFRAPTVSGEGHMNTYIVNSVLFVAMVTYRYTIFGCFPGGGKVQPSGYLGLAVGGTPPAEPSPSSADLSQQLHSPRRGGVADEEPARQLEVSPARFASCTSVHPSLSCVHPSRACIKDIVCRVIQSYTESAY